jgi:hypothetical protein
MMKSVVELASIWASMLARTEYPGLPLVSSISVIDGFAGSYVMINPASLVAKKDSWFVG